MSRDEFLKSLCFVTQEVLDANELFEAYVSVYNKQEVDTDVMNRAPGFFQLVLHSFLRTSIIALSRLYDGVGGNCRNSITLAKLRNIIEQNFEDIGLGKDIKNNIIEQIDQLLEKQKDAIQSLKYLRNKALAHNDKTSTSEGEKNPWIAAKISIGMYREMITAAYEIICICLDSLNLPLPIQAIGIDDDLDTIINALTEK